MHFLTSLIMVFGFAFLFCLALGKMIWDLSQAGAHESPVILEAPGKPASPEGLPAKVTESHESSPMELSDTQ